MLEKHTEVHMRLLVTRTWFLPDFSQNFKGLALLYKQDIYIYIVLISNFRCVLNVVCFLSVPSSYAGTYLHMKMEQTECSERWHIKFRRQGITQKKEYKIYIHKMSWTSIHHFWVVTCLQAILRGTLYGWECTKSVSIYKNSTHKIASAYEGN